MPWMIKGGERFNFAPEDVEAAVGAGYSFEGDDVAVQTPSGPMSVSADQAVDYARNLGRFQTRDEEIALSEEARKQRLYDSAGEKAISLAQNAADTASMGAFSALGRAIDPTYTGRRRERDEVNTGYAIAGKIVGLAPALASGSAGTLGQLSRLTPMGQVGRLGATGLTGMVAEGAITGAADSIQDVLIAEDPLSVETLAGAGLRGGLLGGATGLGVGLFGKAMHKGLNRAKEMADDIVAKGANAGDDALESGARFVDEAAAYRGSMDDAFLVADDEAKAILGKQGTYIRDQIATPKSLAKNPRSIARALEKEETVLQNLVSKQDDIIRRLDDEGLAITKELDGFAGGAVTKRTSRRYADFTGKHLKKGKVLELTAEQAQDFVKAINSGAVAERNAQAMAKVSDLLERNQSLQAGIEQITQTGRAGASAKPLSMGANMVESAVQGTAFGAVKTAMGALPGSTLAAGWVSRKLSDLVFKRGAGAALESAKRTSKAIEAFLEVGGKTAVKTAAPPLATKILSSVDFSHGMESKSKAPTIPAPKGQSKPSTLLSAFRKVEKDLRAQTQISPEGVMELTGRARHQVANELRGVRVAAPVLADRLETQLAKQISFLAEKLPKMPDHALSTLGPSKWQPSELEMRSFARYVAAAEDPGGVEERLAQGTVSPEDAEAYKTLYPERFANLQRILEERLPELRATMPYGRRLAYSIFTGVPVDPAMEPRILAVLQQQFTAEPGTDGGNQPPQAQPQFGSITKPEATKAQERSA